MKALKILITLLTLTTISSYAQSVKSNSVVTKAVITEFKIESEDINQLNNFEWEMIHETFKENDAEQEISVTITIANKPNVEKTDIPVDNFELKVTGKKENLDNIISNLKKTIEKLT
jgi:acetolactate synthase small subunit